MSGAGPKRTSVVVTVGMGPWPFDRLISGVAALCGDHDVFVQTGTSTVVPPCPHAPFVDPDELDRRIAAADVVITHAGNTVRTVQRIGKVPVAVARESARGEMGNDHQVTYLRAEQETGRVIAVWDVASLPETVKHHNSHAAAVADRPLPQVADPQILRDRLDHLVADLCPPRPGPGWHGAGTSTGPNPFARHPLARLAFAYDAVTSAPLGPHLDFGAGTGELAAALAQGTNRRVTAVDAHPGYVAALRARLDIEVHQVRGSEPLPLPDRAFASVSMLDVLEHVPDEAAALAQAYRVLRPGGRLVVTVPHRHVFSGLDPDNAKFRFPRLHRTVYSARFGASAYRERFTDTSDGLRGDQAASRTEHTNYRTAQVVTLLRQAGFAVERIEGANLFWRWLQVPALLGPDAVGRALAPLVTWDGRAFTSPRYAANLHLIARRP